VVSTRRRDYEDIDESDLNEVDDEVEDDDLDDPEDVDEDEIDDEEQEEVAGSDDEEESDQASLDELLAQRAAARRGTEDSDDEADIMAFPSTVPKELRERVPTRVAPPRNRQEFVCARCRLVKPRVQLADEERGLCRDCV
jgi:hypothetical protein